MLLSRELLFFHTWIHGRERGVPLTEVFDGGPGLAFVVFPKALNLLPIGAGNILAILFFSQSFLSRSHLLFPSTVGCFGCSRLFSPYRLFYPGARRLCISVLFFSPFTFQNGQYLLDVVDHFIVQYGIVAVGFTEVLVLAWGYGAENIRSFVNTHAEYPLGRWFFFFFVSSFPSCWDPS